MDRSALLRLLDEVRAGSLPQEAAAERIAAVLPGAAPAAAAHDAAQAFRIDHHRALRCGAPEVVLGSGKAPADLARIAHEVLARAPRLLVTRVDAERVAALQAALPDAVHHERARCVTVDRAPPQPGRAGVLVLCAGTADVPVAEEARVTAAMLGEAPEALYDVGVAGLHRLTSRLELLRAARVIVVAAGMDGALPSVVGGLVAVPVIAVPTSVGYGLGMGGIAPLLTMANACAPNVTFVNIDNGFGAGYVASLVNRGAAG
ncbi:MAG: nickel pincer cofactor biosynthesis protein LarB [Planctomycetia bacterium]